MTKHLLFPGLIVAIILVGCNRDPYPSHEEIEAAVRAEVDNGRTPSIALALFDKGEEWYFNYGKPYEGSDRDGTRSTIYELASVSKVFVTTIFADFVLKGKLQLDDRMCEYLPDSLEFNDPGMEKIQLHQLASHTAGFPTLIERPDLRKLGEYYSGHSVTDLFVQLEKAHLLFEPGTEMAYSNIHIALLAYVLTETSGMTLDSLLAKYYCIPFGMENTFYTVPEEKKRNFATPYIRPGRPIDHWEWDAEKGAGGLRSTTVDLVTFLKKLFYDESELNEAARLATTVEFNETQITGSQIGLGWFITPDEDALWVGHGGRHDGVNTAMMYDLNHDRGIVVLSNSSRNIIDIAMYMAHRKNRIRHYRQLHSKPLKDGGFEKYAGTYSIQVFGTKDTVQAYEQDGLYLIYSPMVGEKELVYRGRNRFTLLEDRASFRMKRFEEGKATKIWGYGITGERIE